MAGVERSQVLRHDQLKINLKQCKCDLQYFVQCDVTLEKTIKN